MKEYKTIPPLELLALLIFLNSFKKYVRRN